MVIGRLVGRSGEIDVICGSICRVASIVVVEVGAKQLNTVDLSQCAFVM